MLDGVAVTSSIMLEEGPARHGATERREAAPRGAASVPSRQTSEEGLPPPRHPLLLTGTSWSILDRVAVTSSIMLEEWSVPHGATGRSKAAPRSAAWHSSLNRYALFPCIVKRLWNDKDGLSRNQLLISRLSILIHNLSVAFTLCIFAVYDCALLFSLCSHASVSK